MQPQDFGIGELFWAIHEGVIVTEAATGRIVLWNPAAEEIFGYPAAEAVGLSSDCLFPQQETHQALDTTALRHHTARRGVQLAARHKEGQEIAVELTRNPLGLPGGQAKYLLWVVRDVGEQQEVRQALQKAKEEAEAALRRLAAEQNRAESLLHSILPAPVAVRLKNGEHTIADYHDDVTVLFADIVNFTPFSSDVAATEVVGLLNTIFAAFDFLAAQQGLEKIKTVGDSYMVAGGLPMPHPDHAAAVADLALEMRDALARLETDHAPFQLRMGIHSGPVVAGVIGTWKLLYDLWGDTVNTASRMESHGIPGMIQVSEATYRRLENRYDFTKREPIEVKGKGEMQTYLLLGRKVADQT